MSAAQRFLWIILVASLAGTCGCFSRGEKTANGDSPTPAPPDRDGLLITPAASPAGRVASVNLQGRFVVLSFPIGQVPPPDTRLNVYRGGLKVGELKVGDRQLDNLVVADITAGTAQVDDEARAE